MDRLTEEAARLCGHLLVSDGLELTAVRIVHRQSLTVDLRVNSLSGDGGFSSAPARFSVMSNSTVSADAFFGCGIGEQAEFWYPRSLKRSAQWVVEDYSGWAFRREKNYSESTISSWIDRRSFRKRGGGN